MSILFWVMAYMVGGTLALSVIGWFSLLDHRMRQIWVTVMLLVAVCEQMQNQVEYAGWAIQIPPHAWALIILAASFVITQQLMPRMPLPEDER